MLSSKSKTALFRKILKMLGNDLALKNRGKMYKCLFGKGRKHDNAFISRCMKEIVE